MKTELIRKQSPLLPSHIRSPNELKEAGALSIAALLIYPSEISVIGHSANDLNFVLLNERVFYQINLSFKIDSR